MATNTSTVTIFSSTVAILGIAATTVVIAVIIVGIAAMAQVAINATMVDTVTTTREITIMETISKRQALRTTVLTT